jgi:drug/metabolite transporter (DMT)-like permease
MILTVVFAMAAAFSNGVNVLTQHWASVTAPKRAKGWGLVTYLVRQPVWLLGWIAAVGGFAFQAVALHQGQLSVVQPLLVTELVFVLALRRVWIGQAVTSTAWAAVVVVCVALAVFLSVAEPAGGNPNPTASDWLSILIASGSIIVVLVAAGTRGSPMRRAAVFATAAALAWALMATFLKTVTDTLAASGLGGLLSGWPVYALAVAAISGTVLEQAALHVGPLSVSQPLLVIINPLASIILSVWLFDERFTNSPPRIVVAVLAFAAVAAGVVALSRASPQDLTPQPARRV